MRTKFFTSLTIVLSLFFSAPVFAHISETSDGWMGALLHPFTGTDHLLMIIFIGIGIAYNIRKYRNLDK